MSESSMEVRRVVAVSPERIWPLVATPAGHVQIDGSGMLVTPVDDRTLTAVGDTFDMEMDRDPLGDIPLG
jgi:hypothetical protein